MRVQPLYRIRFTYPESWAVEIGGGWEQHFYLADGTCEGALAGRFRGANFPQRAAPSGRFRPDFRAVIETYDGATILVELRGYGRAYPPGRRQIVGMVVHQTDAEQYLHLNDTFCVCVGEVRTSADPDQREPDLIVDVAELVWEPIAD